MKQQSEEEHVTCMMDIVSAMISPEDRHQSSASLPYGLRNLLGESCLLPAIASYLRNDSGRYLYCQTVCRCHLVL